MTGYLAKLPSNGRAGEGPQMRAMAEEDGSGWCGRGRAMAGSEVATDFEGGAGRVPGLPGS